MPRYQSKPRVITAVQFAVETGTSTAQMLGVTIRRRGHDTYEVWNQLHESWIKLKPGDYVRIDDSNDNYPIDEDTFNNTYTLVNEADESFKAVHDMLD